MDGPQAVEGVRDPAPSGEQAPRGTVLVIDDDPGIRGIFASALRHCGYLTLAAASGGDALELLAANDVDVILLDMEMPGLSGLDLVRVVRADPRHETLGIAFVSGGGTLDRKLAELEPSVPLDTFEDELQRILRRELALRSLSIRAASAEPPLGGEGLSISAVEGGARVRVPLRCAGVLVGVLDATVDARAEAAMATLRG